MKTLFEDVRTSENLFGAWRHVRRRAQNSKNSDIRGKAAEFEHQHQRHLKRIQSELRTGKFLFDGVEGVLKDKKQRQAKNKDPRPIAIGTIRNRIVQRAILQVLQPRSVLDPRDFNARFTPRRDPRLGTLNDVNSSEFGVGGLMAPFGGVKPAIKFVMQEMARGAAFYYQSDIRAFFTKIPSRDVVEIVRRQTKDEDLAQLFSDALEVNLANKDELLSYARLFPSEGVGVAQGSSLSAFAGNVLLYSLDHELNAKDVAAVRYIDDLFMLSKSEAALRSAISYAKSRLAGFGFSLYEPTPGSDKAACGQCRDAFNFLGCTIQPNRCVPSKASIARVKMDVDDALTASKRNITAFLASGKSIERGFARSATLDRIGKKLFGWQKSFAFCTDHQAFRALDADVARRVLDYEHWVHRKTLKLAPDQIMEVLGIPNTEDLYRVDQERSGFSSEVQVQPNDV